MRRALDLITACILVDSMMYIILPIIYKSVGISYIWQVGLLLATNRLFRLPASSLFTWFVTRYGVYRSLQVAAGLAVLTSIGYAFAHGFWMWFLLRMIWGCAWGLFRLAGYIGLLQDPISDGNAESAGLMQRSMQLGSLFGMFLGGWLAERLGISWTVILFAMSMSLVWMRFEWSRVIAPPKEAFEKPQVNTQSVTTTWWKHPSMKLWLQAGIVYFFSYALHVLTSTYVGALFVRHASHDALQVWMMTIGGAAAWGGWLHGVRYLFQAYTNVKIGKLIDRFSQTDRSWTFSLLITSVVMVAITVIMDVNMFMGLLIWLLGLWLSSILGIWIDSFAMTNAKLANHREKEMSSFSLATDLGASLAPLISFILLDSFGWTWLMIGFAGLPLLCILIERGLTDRSRMFEQRSS